MKMSDKIRALQEEVDDLKFATSRLSNMVLSLQTMLTSQQLESEQTAFSSTNQQPPSL
ncbi:hypothetical protein OMQ46_14535 [Methylophaga sp. OBS1]|nr:hypothetical protein [Methylophaga sp. OBS1]